MERVWHNPHPQEWLGPEMLELYTSAGTPGPGGMASVENPATVLDGEPTVSTSHVLPVPGH